MNRFTKRLSTLTLTSLILLAAISTPQQVHAAPAATVNQVVVTGLSSDWAFYNDNGTSGDWTAGFKYGPSNPPAGSGSVNIQLNSTTAGIIFGTAKYQGTKLTDITALSYSTYTNLSPTAMAFQINYDPDVTVDEGTWYGRLIYEPYQNGTVNNNTWQTWDMINGGNGNWWASNNANSSVDNDCPQASPCTWSHLISLYPSIGIRSGASSLIQFKAGSNWNGFNGYVDAFSFTTGGNTDVYNFELPNTVYVDGSWAGTGNGADPDGAGPATSFGVDAFDTVQNGINGVQAGGTVQVAAGTYTEDLTIDRPLSLLGPNNAVNPNTGTRSAEAILHPASSGTDPYGTCIVNLYVEKSNTTIKGFTIDGNNPGNTSGILVNGVDVDACEGVAGWEGMENTVFENNIVKNTTYTGVDFDNYTNSTATAGNYIRYNKFENIGNPTIGFGIGVLIYDNFYADITDNVFNNVRVGIQTGNYSQANPGTTGSISNNTINAIRLGIFHNLWYSNASTIPVSGNTINAVSSADSNKWNGILIASFQGTVNTTISNNTINIGTILQNPSAGYNVWNTPTTAALTISGGTVTGGNYGVWVNNFEGYGSPSGSNAGNTSIKIDGITINNAAAAGVFVSDSASNTNGATVYANIQNSTISNSATGILVSGSDATAKANLNKITGNTTKGINNTSGNLMDGKKNWWGHITGPASSGTGSGDSVSTNVDFTPWCGNASCSFFVPPFPLVVTANNQTITVGQPDPTFTASYTGFVHGNTSADLDVLPVCSVSGVHSAAGSYTISCAGGSDAEYSLSYATGILTVNAANNPPTDISLSNSSINENQASGSLVGTLSTTDPDAGNTFTYSFCGGTNDASFQISGSNLQSAAVFDFEAKSSYSVCIRSTDNTSLSTTKTLVISINNLIDTATFEDVPTNAFAWAQIESIYAAHITGGCSISPLLYCPDNSLTRAQMAVFLLKSVHGSSFAPPAVAGSTGFADVATDYWAAAWIKQLAAEGITSGCGGGNYCPDATVTRAQMAVFLLKAKNGSSYAPPAVGGSSGFSDVAIDYWAAASIKQLVADGITSGCGGGNYCPENPVTRAQMAIFLQRTFNLPLP